MRSVSEVPFSAAMRACKSAMDFAFSIDTKIILIDGQQLAGFMIDNNVGVSPVAAYEIKRIDQDYFGED